MKLFGSIKELVSAVFRKDTYEVTLKPNSNTYTGATEFQLPPKTNGNGVLVASGDIVNADIAAGAGIEGSKVQAANGTTNAGVVSTGAQSFGGVKTFLSNPVMDGLTASQAVVTDSSKNLASLNYGSTNTASTLVQRDASGNFAAGTITANLTGNVSGSAASFTGSLAGEVTGTQSATVIASGVIDNDNIAAAAGIVDTKLATISTAGKVANSATSATTAATPSTIVLRDGSGNISGAQVSGNISGSAASVTGTVAIANGGTGQTSASAAINALLPSQAANFNKYLKTDGTNVSWASASGGAGEINAVLNASGADGTTGWTAGTSHSITTTTGVTMPLSPAVATAFSMSSSAAVARDSQTNSSGDYYEFTMPPGLQNKKLKLEFYAKTPASADGTWAVALYKGATKIILSTDTGAANSEDTVLLANTTYKFVAYFDADASATYRVNFVQRTRTGANSLYVTNVIVGPGIQPQGAVVGEWQSYTGTVQNGGTATFNYVVRQWRRVGDSIQIEYGFGVTENGSGTTHIQIPLPVSTVDLTKAPNLTLLGSGTRISGGTSNAAFYPRVVTSPSTGVGIATSTGGILTGAGMASGEEFYFNFTVPIAEWAGSGTVQLAQNDVEYSWNSSTSTASDTTSFGYGPGGVLFQAFAPAGVSAVTKRVQFQSPIQIGDKIELEVSDGNGWVPFVNRLNAFYADAAGTTYFGTKTTPVSGEPLKVDVLFFSKVDSASAWSAISSWKWRVRKSSAGAAVGFGLVRPGVSAGLVSASGLAGNTTGNAIAAGYVGERIFVQSTTAAVAAGITTRAITVSGTPMTLSIPTAGVWLLSGQAYLPWSGAANGSSFILSTVSSTSSVFSETGVAVNGITDVTGVTQEGNSRVCTVPAVRAIFSGPATIYLNAYSALSVSATGVWATLMAVRIA